MNKQVKTIKDISKYHCTGCGACTNLCPTKAISMQTDEFGFLFPIIDEKKCINCGKCFECCPTIKFKFEGDEKPENYAVMASDEIRKTSSSGGMFSLVADYVFKNKGIVCGVVYTEPFKAEFTFAENQEQLEPIKQSKYFQAEVGDCFSKIKEYLDKNRMVLFSACPCQVAGLKNFLGKKYEDLITLDLICHGTPTRELAKAYTKTLSSLDDVESINFRDKEKFAWTTSFTLKKKDGEIIRIDGGKSTYYPAFTGGIAMRECCYKCKYAKIPRVGDITIGDYWRIWDIKPEANDWKGTSLVLVNTDKGKQILEKIKSQTKLCLPMPLESAIAFNDQLSFPNKRVPTRNEFLTKIKTQNFDDVLKECIDMSHFDVGLFGYWYASNYGSVITYYTLYKAIEKLGFSVAMLNPPDMDKDGEPANVFSKVFMQNHTKVLPSCRNFEMNYLNDVCDKFMIGSDQVWTPGSIGEKEYLFMFDVISDQKVKIAYASSFGRDKLLLTGEQKAKLSYLLSRIDAISVREDSGVEICKNEFNIEAEQNVDPVFLWGGVDVSFYDELAEESNIQEDEPYIVSYILDANENKRKVLLDVQKKKNGMKLINMLDARHGLFEGQDKILNLPNSYPNLLVEDWVKLFKNAEFVVTDSHHGLAMAVLFNKPVIAIVNEERGSSRFYSLVKWLGIPERLIAETDDIFKKDVLFTDIDYNKVNKIIEKKRQQSLKWLKDKLSMQKSKKQSSVHEYVNYIRFKYEKIICDLEYRLNESQNQINDLRSEIYKTREETKQEFEKRPIKKNLVRRFFRSLKNNGLIETCKRGCKKVKNKLKKK